MVDDLSIIIWDKLKYPVNMLPLIPETSCGVNRFQITALHPSAPHCTSAPLLQICILLLNVNYSGEHETLRSIAPLCSPVQNALKDFLDSSCQCKHGGRGRSWKFGRAVKMGFPEHAAPLQAQAAGARQSPQQGLLRAPSSLQLWLQQLRSDTWRINTAISQTKASRSWTRKLLCNKVGCLFTSSWPDASLLWCNLPLC